MEKVKIHPLTLAALLISTLLMASYAYRNFHAEETTYEIVFVLLSIFLLGLAINGFIRNQKVSEK